MSDPKVSVLMPAFNAAPYIEDSIRSILNQTLTDFELLICDDCSSDGTRDIISRLAAQDDRIVPMFNEKNLGIPGNRNRLLHNAQAQYVAWQDSDDLSYPDRLEAQYRFLEDHPEVGIVGGFLEFFGDGRDVSIRKYPADDRALRRMIFKVTPVSQGAAMVRKSIAIKAGGFNTDFSTAEDLDLLFRIAQQSRMANLQQPVLKYRQITTSSTYKGVRNMELNSIKLRRRFRRDANFTYRLTDRVFLTGQLLSLYLMSPKIRIKLFELVRNSKAAT